MMTFSYGSKSQFLVHSPEIADHIGRFGYAVVKPWNSGADALLAVAERFGRIQSHIRADASGCVGIATQPATSRQWEQYRSEYLGLNNEEFLPHTDGSYLHGMVPRDGAYEQVLPPRMLLLQCVQSAEAGGRHLLIDGQAVRRDLARERPGDLALLSKKGCVTYCRDDQIALDCAVFHELADGTTMLRFRFDSTAYVADWAAEAFRTLQDRYFANSAYWQRRDLAEGEILFVDNHRMLHGREAFAETQTGRKRQMRRVWLAHDGLPVLQNAAGKHVERRALERFRPYEILPAARSRAEILPSAFEVRHAA